MEVPDPRLVYTLLSFTHFLMLVCSIFGIRRLNATQFMFGTDRYVFSRYGSSTQPICISMFYSWSVHDLIVILLN